MSRHSLSVIADAMPPLPQAGEDNVLFLARLLARW